ncbi:hypothetical protein HK102_007172, partial [Quaeritorhiza haematococci]
MMIAVGYMDPGNWSTDLAAGSQYGYKLLFVVLLSNLFAILLQHLCIKLGIVTGHDLAQISRRHFHPAINMILYILCETAIVATDLAEVIGTAIGLNLLFHLPLAWGVALTALDVLIVLFFWNSSNLRLFELIIACLVFLVGFCFAILLGYSHPDWVQAGLGYLPKTELATNAGMLYLGIGIIGATVMPHNLYLHSNLVRYRCGINQSTIGEIGDLDDDVLIEDSSTSTSYQPLRRRQFLPDSIRMSTIDAVLSLSFALLINSSILIVAAASFSETDVGDLKDAHSLMVKKLGGFAGVLFALALLFSGQSSTVTGTLAGQIVMEGFLGSGFRIPTWARRLATRAVAIVPALTVVLVLGEEGLNRLLVLSQVVLSLQLPFAVWPLVYFTSRRSVMTIRFRSDEEDSTESEHNVERERPVQVDGSRESTSGKSMEMAECQGKTASAPPTSSPPTRLIRHTRR